MMIDKGPRFELSRTPLGVPMEPLAYHPRTGRPVYPIAGGDGTEPTLEERVGVLTHSQCLSRMEEIASTMERLAERAELSSEDEEYRDGLAAEFTLVDQRRAALETAASVAQIAARTQAITGRPRVPEALRLEAGSPNLDRDSILEPDSVEDRRFKDPWDLRDVRTYGREDGELVGEYRARALSAIEKMPMSADNIRSTATDLIERYDDEDGNLSRLVLAISSPAYVRAWSKMAVDPNNGFAKLSENERAALTTATTVARQTRALSLSDPNGGYLVPFQLDPTVILTSDGSYNEIRQIARQVVATGDVWNGVSAGAVQWSFDPEASEVSDDSPTFGAPAIPVYTARGFVPISLEARMDAANIAAEVARLLAQGKDDLEAIKFAVGSGTAEPTGIITALTGTTSIVTSTTADTFAYNDLYKVQGALPARYRSRAAWLANNLFYNLVRQTSPVGAWNDPAQGREPSLLGRAVHEAEAMDGTVNATQENYLAVFGDFSNFVIADRIGMTVDFIPHLFGANRRPTGQSGWFAFYRVGSDSVNDAGFRMYNVT